VGELKGFNGHSLLGEISDLIICAWGKWLHKKGKTGYGQTCSFNIFQNFFGKGFNLLFPGNPVN